MVVEVVCDEPVEGEDADDDAVDDSSFAITAAATAEVALSS